MNMLKRAQRFTASINDEDYQQSWLQFKESNAFARPTEAQLIIKDR